MGVVFDYEENRDAKTTPWSSERRPGAWKDWGNCRETRSKSSGDATESGNKKVLNQLIVQVGGTAGNAGPALAFTEVGR